LGAKIPYVKAQPRVLGFFATSKSGSPSHGAMRGICSWLEPHFDEFIGYFSECKPFLSDTRGPFLSALNKMRQRMALDNPNSEPGLVMDGQSM
jgi:hypothetical protein